MKHHCAVVKVSAIACKALPISLYHQLLRVTERRATYYGGSGRSDGN